MTTQALARRNGKPFCRKRVLVKAVIPPSISKETVRRILPKTDLKWTHFQSKEIMSKNDLKLRLKFARKVYCKRATMKYEIIRKPMVLERVEINLLKSAHCYQKQNLQMILNLMNSKEVSGKACEIWLKLRLHKDMATFQILQTLIGHNATRYRTRYCIFSPRFAWFQAICNALPSFF